MYQSTLEQSKKMLELHRIRLQASCKRFLRNKIISKAHSLSFGRLNCQTTTNCILGGSALGSVKEQPFQTGIKATSNLLQSIEKRSCVDQYVQDQLIIFMALANGTSRIVCDSPITEHTKTAIYVIELLTQVIYVSNKQCISAYLY